MYTIIPPLPQQNNSQLKTGTTERCVFFLTAIPKNLLFLKRKHYKEVFLLHFRKHKLLSPVF